MDRPADTIEKPAQQLCQPECRHETHAQPRTEDLDALPRHELDDLSLRRAHGHPNPDLANARPDAERERAIETDRREEHGDAGEAPNERQLKALGGQGIGDARAHRRDA